MGHRALIGKTQEDGRVTWSPLGNGVKHEPRSKLYKDILAEKTQNERRS